MAEKKRLIKKTGLDDQKFNALELLEKERKGELKRKIDYYEEEEISNYDENGQSDLEDFIEGDILYDNEENFEEQEQRRIKEQNRKRKQKVTKIAPVKKEIKISEQESADLLKNLMEQTFGNNKEIETIKVSEIKQKGDYQRKRQIELEKYNQDIKDIQQPSMQPIKEANTQNEDSYGINIEKIDELIKQHSNKKEKILQEIEEKEEVEKFPINEKQIQEESETKKKFIRNQGTQDSTLDIEQEQDFYWIDAYEDYNFPGQVFLFGKIFNKKTQELESCLLEIHNIYRKLYFVPNFDNNILSEKDVCQNLFQEIEDSIPRKKKNYKDIKVYKEVVEKNYCFELDLLQKMFVEVRIQFDPLIFTEKSKGKYYKGIIGTSYSALELFLIEKEIKGPCWLKVKNFSVLQGNILRKQKEISVECAWGDISISDIKMDPPLKVLSISLISAKLAKSAEPEILSISGVFNEQISVSEDIESKQETKVFNILRESGTGKFKCDDTLKVKNEYALISLFISKIAEFDPDVIICHELYSKFFELLITRINKLKIMNTQNLSRLVKRQLQNQKSINAKIRQLSIGRLLVDSYLSSKDIVRESDYSLSNLSSKYLNKALDILDNDTIVSAFLSQDEKCLKEIISNSVQHAQVSMELVKRFQILPLTLQLTKIAGNLWAKSLQNSRAERNELLLMHEFHKNNYILPDKFYGKQDDKLLREGEEKVLKKKAKYAGGKVLEPKQGYYKNIVLLLDFNSLYPSIIQEFNICFTTVIREKKKFEDIRNIKEESEDIGQVLEDSSQKGILPSIVKSLVDRRKAVKALIRSEKNESKLQMLDIRQKAIKLIANSIYGCLGFQNSRFFAQPIAALITYKGRDILEKSVKFVTEKLQYDVIYGDTDSIMINANTESLVEAIKIGNNIKKEINKHYKCLEIEIDGVFKPLLLFRKKKYAAKKMANLQEIMSGLETNPFFVLEIKGIDLVRRDWCDLSKNIGKLVLDELIKGQEEEEAVSEICNVLENLKKKMDSGEIKLKDYILTKQLTKSVNDYSEIASLPHVQVAKRLIQESGGNPQSMIGSFVHYVICKGRPGDSLGQRAFHPKELLSKHQGEYEIDIDYYKSHQIMPPITRLCSFLQSDTIPILAQALGLDPNKFTEKNEQEEIQDLGQEKDYFNFPHDPIDLNLYCLKCQKETEKLEQHRNSASSTNQKLETNKDRLGCNIYCCLCGEEYLGVILMNKIQMILKDHFEKYYKGQVQCEEEECMAKSRQITMKAGKCQMQCNGDCISVYSDRRIYQNLYFLKKYLDQELKKESSQNKFLQETASKIENILSKFRVNLGNIFSVFENQQIRINY